VPVELPRVDEIVKVAEFRAALRQFLRRTEKVAARHGLTPQRYLLLLMIKGAADGSQRSTVTELAGRLQLAQHTVTELVARAVRSGLVRRQASAVDRRVTYLRLTSKGETLLGRSFTELETDRQHLESLIGRLH
jgi:DNA-binding MarR family transcriptional regulator